MRNLKVQPYIELLGVIACYRISYIEISIFAHSSFLVLSEATKYERFAECCICVTHYTRLMNFSERQNKRSNSVSHL